MPTKQLPDGANLKHLKNQAKDLLRDQRQGALAAAQRIREFHPNLQGDSDDAIFAAT